MTCHEFSVLLGDTPAALLDLSCGDFAHARECAACACLLEQRILLRSGLQSLARQQAGLEPPARLEAALLAEFRRAHLSAHSFPAPARPAQRLWQRWPAWAFAAAAALVFLVIGSRPFLRHTANYVAVADSSDAADTDSGFVPLPFAVAAGPSSDADIVRVEVPRSELVALGLSSALEGSGDAVEAEVLLGDGGVPEAIRVLE
jgi:hypothetical protein